MIDLLNNLLITNKNWGILLFVGLILIAGLGAKIVYYILSKTLKAFTEKTKTKMDDVVINAFEKPAIIFVMLFFLNFGKALLYLSEKGLITYNQIMTTILILTIGWTIVRFLDSLIEHYIKPLTSKTKSKLDDTLLPMLKSVVNAFIYAIVLVIVLQDLGIEISGLIAGLGIGGLAFALAAQDILSNFFGGAAVIADRPFEVGDRIRLDGNDGFVRKIGLRTTTLETFDGTMIVIPNKKVADTTLENISRERARRVKIVLGVEYNTSTAKLEKAKKILKDIIKKNKLTDDESLVHFKGFNDSSLDIQVIYWIKDLDNILATKDEVNFAIKKAFEKEGVEFAYPSQTVYLKK